MAIYTEQITYSNASGQISTTLSGNDGEVGNEEINAQYAFTAATTNGTISISFTASNLQAVFLMSDKGGTLTTNGTGTADQQTFTVTGTPTGGTFPVGFNGQVTDVAYNVSAATLQAALRALSTIGGSNITCSGGALPGTPIVCTFAGALATGQQSLFTTYSGSLTGGSTPTVAVAHNVPGLPSNTIILAPGVPIVWGTSQGYGSNPFTVNVSSAYFTCTPSSRLWIRILSL